MLTAGVMKDGIMRIGIFGAGKMAMHHIHAIRMLEHAKIVAVADPVADRDKLKSILPDDVSFFSAPAELLDNARPDIVHICTPPASHAELARVALNKGANVYLEKPFALTLKEAREIIALAKERNLRVCAGHQLLFESHMLDVKKQLDNIGRIVHVESYFSFKPVRRSSDGRTAMPAIEQLIDILPHPVYLLGFFLKWNQNKDVSIETRGIHVRTEGDVHGIFSCGNATGLLVVTLTGRPIESYIKVIGTNGSLCAEFVRGTYVINPGPGVSGISKVIFPYSQAWQSVTRTTKALYRRIMKKHKSYPGLLELIGAFYGSIGPGKEDVLPASGILETVAVCEEVGSSLRSLEEKEERLVEADFLRREREIPPVETGKGKVLVTGGTGLLGRSVMKELRNNRYDVLTISRKNQPYSERVPGVQYLKGDLGERIPDDLLRGVTTVVHCAAETAGGKEAHERNSVGATRNLLEAMSANGAGRLIHISSLGILRSSKETGRPIDENTPVEEDAEGRGPYVWGKAESERIALELGRSLGIQVSVIRPGPLVDFDSFTPPGRLGREAGPYFVMIGKKRDKLSLCSVQTAAKVIRYYMECRDSVPPLLNLIEPDAPTRGELVSLFLKDRPDLSVLRIPSPVFWCLSALAMLLQRVLRPGRKPLDVYAAFASEKYDSSLAGRIIAQASSTR